MKWHWKGWEARFPGLRFGYSRNSTKITVLTLALKSEDAGSGIYTVRIERLKADRQYLMVDGVMCSTAANARQLLRKALTTAEATLRLGGGE